MPAKDGPELVEENPVDEVPTDAKPKLPSKREIIKAYSQSLKNKLDAHYQELVKARDAEVNIGKKYDYNVQLQTLVTAYQLLFGGE